MRTIGVKALTASALAVLAAAALPVSAQAGTYTAIQCAPSNGAGAGGFGFRRTSREFRSARDCDPGGSGLRITHAHSKTKPRRYGAWAASAQPGTVFLGGSVRARGNGHNAYKTRLAYRTTTDHSVTFAHPSQSEFKRYAWRPSEAADGLDATLVCARRSAKCGPSDKPKLYVKGARFRIADLVPPRITGVGGTILQGDAQRASQSFAVGATDVGSGIERLLMSVNGVFYDSRSAGCTTRGELALSLSPCPNRTELATSMNTAAAPFHEGQNSIRACVTDYAQTAPHSRCVHRTIRVDNDCPISSVTSGTRVRLHFVPQSRTTRKVRYGRRPTVAGRVSSNAGVVRGAAVCVSQRPALRGSAERTIAVRTTGPQGAVRQRLPSGPSRIVYLTYWRSAESVVTRAVHLRVRPKVSLRVKPRGTLHRGTRPRYVVHLRGPYRAHRMVRFQARAPGGRWFDLPGRAGAARTSRTGVARGRMPRLRASTSYELSFRAVVPKQDRYPYICGTSRVRKRFVKLNSG